MTGIDRHKAVQAIAKRVLHELGPTIHAQDTERTIADRAIRMLAELGVTDTWYHHCPALVLLGSRSCLSISGRGYIASDEAVGQVNLVTVDLSPSREGVWGDCARSFYIHDGTAHRDPPAMFERGATAEAALHGAMRRFVTPQTKCSALFEYANAEIHRLGFENLDFLGNLGHSIASRPEARVYIDRNSDQRLGEIKLFTFEPHIRQRGAAWGYKHENIYYFDATGSAVEL